MYVMFSAKITRSLFLIYQEKKRL